MLGFAFGIEVCTTLGTSQGKTGEAILKRLLEREKFKYAAVDCRVKANAAFVGSDRVIVLNPPAALDTNVVVIVLPTNAKTHDPIGFNEAPQDLVLMIDFLVCDEIKDVLGDFPNRLHELRLSGIAFFDTFHELRISDVVCYSHISPFRNSL